MRLLFLTSDLDVTNGWGRYAAGFLAQAKARLGEGNVVAPDPATLRSAKPAVILPLRLLSDVWRLLPLARRADVIHAATEPTAPLAWTLSKLSGRPYVVSAHGTYADANAYGPLARWWMRRAFRGGTVVAVSRYTAEVARRSFAPRRLDVIPGGVADAPAQAPRSAPSRPAKLLAVGALKPRKGFHTLVAAMASLAPSEAACVIVGVGGAEYARRLEDQVRAAKLEGRVSFRGRVSDDELDRLYAESDLFVLPSEHSGAAFEGLGLVYLEALMRGVPSIGCLDSGAEDVIRDGVNGYLVPPGDPPALVKAVRSALRPDVWPRLASAARGSVDGFRWDAVGARMEEQYRSLAKR